MIHVLFNQRGSGKTKNLIKIANEKLEISKGDLVFVDEENRVLSELDNKVRYISSKEFGINNVNAFYGFLCGIISENYDIEAIFIDGIMNIINVDIKDCAPLFLSIEMLSKKFNVEFYLNVNQESEEIPEYLKKYVA